jgi:hypothetical protein
VIAALFGVGVLTGGDEAASPDQRHELDVERVAERLERVRGLEFDRLPPVRYVTPAEAREEALGLLDEQYPPKRRAADEALLTLLGLLPEGSDIRELAGEIYGEEVAGYYDERKRRMTLVEEEGGSGGGAGEITLAHELTHALEDQHFALDPDEGAFDDERTARTALIEGTATVAMLDYSARHVARGRVGRRELLAQLDAIDLLESAGGLPPYLQRSLVFPYSAGARFVDAIGTWGPANRALRGRGPASTEQVLHPAKYRAGERPLRVPPPRAPGGAWKRATAGTIGEFDTAELIRSSDSPVRAERAAAGWGGGRYALWRRGGESALALAWRWDGARDAAEFTAALPRYVERTLGGRPAGPGLWRTETRGFVAVAPGAVVRLAIAPTRRLASALAR